MAGDIIVKTFPFEVTDEEQRLVSGYFGDSFVDIDGHMIDQEGYLKAVKEYLPWGNIREMHDKPIGTIVSYGDKGWNHIVVKIVDDKAWNLVKSGVYKGFSIGARVLAKSWVDVNDLSDEMFAGIPETIKAAIFSVGKVLRVDSLMLSEISIVDRPVNPRALIIAHKGIANEDYKDELLVEDIVLAAQQEWYTKGETNMSDKELVNDEIEESVQDDVEKNVSVEDESEISEDNSKEVDEVVEEVVEKSETEVEESETVVEDVVEDVVEAEEVEKAEDEVEDEEPVFDAEIEVKGLFERMDVIEGNLANISQTLQKMVTSNTEKGEDVDADEPVAEVEPEVEPETEEKAIVDNDLDIDEIITKAAEAAVAKYVAFEDSDERQNVINKGDNPDELLEEDEAPAFNTLSKREKYNQVARVIAGDLDGSNAE